MSHTIVPVPQYDGAALVRTVDGELISDASGPAPYGPLLQALADRALYARGGLWGQLCWSGRFAVDPGGTNTVFAVRVGAISSLCVKDSAGVWRPYYTAAETTLDLGDVEGAPANLSNSTWYYVYAYSDGTSTLRFLINTVAPDATGLWQSAGGDGLRRYLGCFVTTSGGGPIPVRALRGTYRYDYSETAALSVLNITTAVPTSYTNIDCSSLIPLHSVLGSFLVIVTNASTTHFGRTQFRKGGATTSPITLDTPPGNVEHPATSTHAIELQTSSAQVIEYQRVSTASYADCDISVEVLGFTE